MAGGLRLYFSSDRAGTGRDLYVAERPSLSEPFSAPQPISELNTPSLEADPWLSPDLRYLVFASDRSGDSEIYEAWR